MSILNHQQIESMSFDDKVSLIDELWASMDTSEVSLAMDNAYDRLLERRLAACDQELDVLLSLDKASRELREMLHTLSPLPVKTSTAA